MQLGLIVSFIVLICSSLLIDLFFWVIFVVHCVSLNLQYLGQKVLKILHFPTHRMLILIIWYHYGPFPGTTLVNVVQLRSEMVKPDFNIVLGGNGGGGGICNCQCLLYLETRHGNVHFSQNNIVVKDCSLKLWFSSNSCVTWSVSASILIQIRDLTSTTSMKRQKRCMLSISANLCCRFDWSWMQHGHWWPFLKINLKCTKVVVAKLCSIPGGYSRVKVTGMIKRAQKWKPKKTP